MKLLERIINASSNRNDIVADLFCVRKGTKVFKYEDPLLQILPVDEEENKEGLQEWEEQGTGEYIFENEWQSFRTKNDSTLELKTPFNECEKGQRYKIAVKVVDIFGNDTMKIIEVAV